MHVAVIGAGLAGLSAAHYLCAGGAEVSIFEREVEVGLMTSSRNGSLLHPSMVEPWNEPGVLGTLLRNLGIPGLGWLNEGLIWPILLLVGGIALVWRLPRG